METSAKYSNHTHTRSTNISGQTFSKTDRPIIKYLLQLHHFYTDHSIELEFPAASLLDTFCHLSKSEKLPTFSEDQVMLHAINSQLSIPYLVQQNKTIQGSKRADKILLKTRRVLKRFCGFKEIHDAQTKPTPKLSHTQSEFAHLPLHPIILQNAL